MDHAFQNATIHTSRFDTAMQLKTTYEKPGVKYVQGLMLLHTPAEMTLYAVPYQDSPLPTMSKEALSIEGSDPQSQNKVAVEAHHPLPSELMNAKHDPSISFKEYMYYAAIT
ncbi:hypothetical protein HYALB_00004688 [Hymenoscyphus albidus]|uniref:Uncharacterized protein n=1 Tax=Hymenoscyphus albidus TaxID=595503 RepID=A0A9N9Q3U9_9HELO|nr:hypothetical protein HYALB_00004688 [Hymenoscyphus albidus]